MECLDPAGLLPQQPPILMLDRVVEIEPGKAGTGIRRFQPEDPCFQGHFPGNPVLPGVLVIEALAQTAMAVLALARNLDGPMAAKEKPSGLLAGVTKAAFYHTITPGDEVAFKIQVTRKLKRFFMIDGEAWCSGIRCANAALTLATGTSTASSGKG